MLPDLCGSSLLSALPDDIFAAILRFLSPRDVCSLGLTCKDLHSVVVSDKVWLSQCDKLGLIACGVLVEWRKGVCSYMVLYRFLVHIQPLLGIWVHQNPELGNVVYVMPGFLSVVGCRIVPQEVGPLGLEGSPILWAPVFEILCSYDGTAVFFLHGREDGGDYVYPGLLKSVDRACNVLLLEVEPRRKKLAHSRSFDHEVDTEVARRLSRSDSGISKSQRVPAQKVTALPFSRLGFGDRRRLLDTVTSHVRLHITDAANMLLFPRSKNSEVDLHQDLGVLHERRLYLLQVYNSGVAFHDLKSGSELPVGPADSRLEEVRESSDCTSGSLTLPTGDVSPLHCTKGKTLSGILKNGLKQILGKSIPANGMKENQRKTSSSSESKYIHLHEFLQSGDTIGLSLRATTMKLSFYRAWPNMHDSRFALYKLPVRASCLNHEFAGLWGGTFGWPPGRTSEDKPGKALFFILVSYEEYEGHQVLIGTKILEGTSYVLHPNGSAMFIVNTGCPSTDEFPLDRDGDSSPVDIKQSFSGEGIANGYGFRYPGSKPGSLFVTREGLVFVWRESRAVLTLQRLNLPELLKRGEKLPALSPISNFAYLTKTYSNVYSGFSSSTNGLSSSSPRKSPM